MTAVLVCSRYTAGIVLHDIVEAEIVTQPGGDFKFIDGETRKKGFDEKMRIRHGVQVDEETGVMRMKKEVGRRRNWGCMIYDFCRRRLLELVDPENDAFARLARRFSSHSQIVMHNKFIVRLRVLADRRRFSVSSPLRCATTSRSATSHASVWDSRRCEHRRSSPISYCTSWKVSRSLVIPAIRM